MSLSDLIPSFSASDTAADVTITAADMEDPVLLAELAAIMGEAPPPKPADPRERLAAQAEAKKREALQQKRAGNTAAAGKALREYKALQAQLDAKAPPAKARAAAPPGDVDLASLLSGAGSDPSSVTVTDADMNDPDLLAELYAVTGGLPTPKASPRASGKARVSQPPPPSPRGKSRAEEDEMAALLEAMNGPAKGGAAPPSRRASASRKAAAPAEAPLDPELDALVAQVGPSNAPLAPHSLPSCTSSRFVRSQMNGDRRVSLKPPPTARTETDPEIATLVASMAAGSSAGSLKQEEEPDPELDALVLAMNKPSQPGAGKKARPARRGAAREAARKAGRECASLGLQASSKEEPEMDMLLASMGGGSGSSLASSSLAVTSPAAADAAARRRLLESAEGRMLLEAGARPREPRQRELPRVSLPREALAGLRHAAPVPQGSPVPRQACPRRRSSPTSRHRHRHRPRRRRLRRRRRRTQRQPRGSRRRRSSSKRRATRPAHCS